MNIKENMTMLTDFYELTMANGYFENNMQDEIAYFDVFFRKNPDGGGFSIFAGLHHVLEYVKALRFTKEDIAYLKEKNIFSDAFLEYLKDFKFTCDIWAVPEGTPVFPGEPVMIVRGPVIQAQFIETFVLICINHQSLIATKANRIVRAAGGRGVLEFGSRRAHGADAAILGARAAYIGGCTGTACVKADADYGVTATGTMAHSWVQMFDSELDSFRAYAALYPDNCCLLVDTYNVLKSGVPNAIIAFQEEKPKTMAIRIDSGDIAYLAIQARKILDTAGFSQCKIIASNSLDEYLIRDLLRQGAPIDSFGVGEKLITAKSDSVFGGVYKLVAVEKKKEIIPKIKISENIEKITNPAFKQLYRFFDQDTHKAIADVITLHDEEILQGETIEIFNPEFVWKRKHISNFYCKKLLEQVCLNGSVIDIGKEVNQIRTYCKEQIDTLWDEILRFENPHQYYVDLSQKLWAIKTNLIKKHTIK